MAYIRPSQVVIFDIRLLLAGASQDMIIPGDQGQLLTASPSYLDALSGVRLYGKPVIAESSLLC